jgi:regulator of protease activity HflC (stomatin/prohibitin superfamily)
VPDRPIDFDDEENADRPERPRAAGTSSFGPDDTDEPAQLGAAMPIPVGTERKAKGNGGKKRRLPVKTGLVLALVAVVLLALVPAFASGLKKTPRNRVGISYGGGPIEGSHFQRIVQPGHALFFNGFFDPLYTYPSDQQQYIVSLNPAGGTTKGADSIVAPTKDRVQVTYQIATYFKLNTDKLRAFHEQLGLRYNAYTSSGWKNLIAATFRQQIENALQQETRRYNVADIYSNEQVLLKLQTDIQSTLSQRLEAATGGQYFCGPTFEPGGKCSDVTFVIKKVDLPKSVVASFEAQRNSAIAVDTEKNNTEKRAIEAQAIQNLAGVGVTGSDYVLLKAVESGAIKFWVLPQGNGLTLQTGGGATPTTPTTPSGSGSGG